MSNKGRIFIALSCLLFVSACGPSAEELEQRKQRRIANEARDQALFESDGFTKYERALFNNLEKKQNKTSEETAAFLDLWGRKQRHQTNANQ